MVVEVSCHENGLALMPKPLLVCSLGASVFEPDETVCAELFLLLGYIGCCGFI